MRGTVFLLLGILLASPVAAEFCDGNFVVEAGDWSDIEIHDGATVRRESYSWKCRKSDGYNTYNVYDASRYGMPKDTVLHPGMQMYYSPNGGWAPHVVTWLAVHDVRYTYTVVCDGVTYTNNTSSMSYTAVWLRAPYRCCNTDDCKAMNRHADEMTVNTSNDGITFCLVGHITDNDGDKWPTYGEKTIPAGVEDVSAWETPSTNMNATLTNSSIGYYILDVLIPRGVLGYRIGARSDNHDAFCEYSTHMMQRNVTSSGKEFFEVVSAPNMNNSGMSACGANKFILPEDTNYKIDVTVYTPFEQIKMNVSMIHEKREVETVDKRSTLQSLLALITMPLGVYVLIRGMR